jgi:glycosyltransferase involved in cell wall biosynthesis
MAHGIQGARGASAEVSVIIATYRREKLLLEAVSSVRSQQGVEVEVVVVDDSPEGSARQAMTALNDPAVRYVHRLAPSGGRPGAVRNDGVALARAPLIHFLDDDDRLFDGALYDLAVALRASASPMAFGRVVPFGDDDPKMRDVQREYFTRMAAALRRIRGRRWFAAQLLFRDMPLINSACMVRRDAFQAHGGYDPTLRCCEDVDLFLRLGRASGYTFVDRDVLHYRVGAPSVMNELRRAEGGGGGSGSGMQREAYGKMHARYKDEYGTIEYRALQVLARGAGFLDHLPA